MAEDFVDDNRTYCDWRRVGLARRTFIPGAGAPACLEAPSVPRRAVIHDDERKAGTIGDRIPRAVVGKVQDIFAHGVIEAQFLAGIAEVIGVLAGDIKAASVTRSEGRQILDDEDSLARSQASDRAAGEGENDAVGEMHAGQIQRHRPDIP